MAWFGPCLLKNWGWREERGGGRGGSDHGTVGALHLEELDDEGGPPSHDLGGQVAEGAVLNAHD